MATARNYHGRQCITVPELSEWGACPHAGPRRGNNRRALIELLDLIPGRLVPFLAAVNRRRCRP
jgi:hypothetical protein